MIDRSVKLKERDEWKVKERDKRKVEKKIKLKELDFREKEWEKEKIG